MRSVIAIGMVILQSSMIFASVRSDGYQEHLERLRTAYPFGLIGEDFGILTVEDLATNACGSVPRPFSPESDVYPYWQCFETSRGSVDCEVQDYDSDEKSVMAVLGFEVRGDNADHVYLSRRGVRMETCTAYKKDWDRLTANERYFCISGEYWRAKVGPSGRSEMIWGFDKFKSRKGCESYFDGECSPKAKIKRGACLASQVRSK